MYAFITIDDLAVVKRLRSGTSKTPCASQSNGKKLFSRDYFRPGGGIKVSRRGPGGCTSGDVRRGTSLNKSCSDK